MRVLWYLIFCLFLKGRVKYLLMNEEKTGCLIPLICPSCRIILERSDEGFRCNACKMAYPDIEGVFSLLSESERNIVSFYEDWHQDPHKTYNLQGIGKPIRSHPFVERNRWIFEKILNTAFKRERFFAQLSKRLTKPKQHVRILDLGCGAGNPDVLKLGVCYGVDYCLEPLKAAIKQSGYQMVLQCDATLLPFESGQFDCIVSSDFIGHIPPEKKESLFSEMSRVLNKGGLCAHVIETDSDTFINDFAKKYQNLYQKYFIEGIGGHFGLERPSLVIERFRKAGLEPIVVIKYFSYLRDIETFIALFDNEYKEKSRLLKLVLGFYKLLCRNFVIKIFASVILGWMSCLIDALAALNSAEGILVLCRKK